jgi:hypothetical protein
MTAACRRAPAAPITNSAGQVATHSLTSICSAARVENARRSRSGVRCRKNVTVGSARTLGGPAAVAVGGLQKRVRYWTVADRMYSLAWCTEGLRWMSRRMFAEHHCVF